MNTLRVSKNILSKSGLAHTLLMGFFGISLLLGGCKTDKSTSVNDSDSIATEEPIAIEQLKFDSIGYTKTDTITDVSIIFDYPQGTSRLADSVKAFINRQICANSLPEYVDDKTIYPALYKGNPTSKALVNYYGKLFTKRLQKENRENPDIPHEDSKYLLTVSIKEHEQTDKYINFDVNSECFLMGAHGSFTSYNVVIDKMNGKEVQILDTTKVKEMQKLLIDGVYSYFKENGENFKKSNIWDYLMLEKKTIPLPVHQPSLTKDGLSFVYQQYEIAAYACGLPCFTIPYAKVKKYMTEEARKLIE